MLVFVAKLIASYCGLVDSFRDKPPLNHGSSVICVGVEPFTAQKSRASECSVLQHQAQEGSALGGERKENKTKHDL